MLWKLQNTNMNSGIAENSQKVHFLILESQWLISIRSLDTVKGNNTLCWTPGRVNDKTLLLSSELLSWTMFLSQSHLLGISDAQTELLLDTNLQVDFGSYRKLEKINSMINEKWLLSGFQENTRNRRKKNAKTVKVPMGMAVKLGAIV